MLLITTYTVKPYISDAETADLMAVFTREGAAPGEIAHYVRADGGGGVVITETDDILPSYRNNLNYSQWLTFESRVVVPVADAVPSILDALG
jgi:hypothetical protein